MMRFILLLLLSTLLVSAGEKTHASIPVADWKAKTEAVKGTILDVRTPAEYAEGHVKGSKLLNFYDNDFKEKLKAMPKKGTYYVYCRSGGRSGKTLKMMKEMGFPSVYDMAGGMKGWTAANLPVVKDGEKKAHDRDPGHNHDH